MFRRTRTVSSRSTPRIKKWSRHNRLSLQFLEDRTVPTAYLVNATTDTGAGAGTSGDLCYCLTAAAAAGADVISFDTAGIFAGAQTITLTGTLSLPADTTITGSGSAK